jgi:uncharacterized protein YacL
MWTYDARDFLRRCPDFGKEFQKFGSENKKQGSRKTYTNKLAVASFFIGILLIPYYFFVGGFVFLMAWAAWSEAMIANFCLLSIALSTLGIIIGLIVVYQISKGVGITQSIWLAGAGIFINSMIILAIIAIFGRDILDYFGFL